MARAAGQQQQQPINGAAAAAQQQQQQQPAGTKADAAGAGGGAAAGGGSWPTSGDTVHIAYTSNGSPYTNYQVGAARGTEPAAGVRSGGEGCPCGSGPLLTAAS